MNFTGMFKLKFLLSHERGKERKKTVKIKKKKKETEAERITGR